jgi:hypothetical protein
MIDSNLHNTPLFSALDEEAAIALKQSMVPQTVKKGQDLFKEGDAGDRLYVAANHFVWSWDLATCLANYLCLIQDQELQLQRQ